MPLIAPKDPAYNPGDENRILSANASSQQKNKSLRLSTILFVWSLLLFSPFVALAGYSLTTRASLSRLSRIALAIALAAMFLNRDFGVALGGGATDDVPQYVFLLTHVLDYTPKESLQTWTFEPGFIFFARFLAFVGASPSQFLFITFFLSSYALIEGIHRLAPRYASICLLAFFCLFGSIFYGYMHILRQTLAVSLSILGLSFYYPRKARRAIASYTLFSAAGLMHAVAIPLALGAILASKLWLRSRTTLSLLLIIAIPCSLFAAEPFLDLLSGYSSRLGSYVSTPHLDTLGARVSQLILAVLIAMHLITNSIRAYDTEGFAPLQYFLGAMGISLATISASGVIGSNVVSRMYMVILGAMIAIIFTTRTNGELPRHVKPLLAFALLMNFYGQQLRHAPHLKPFSNSQALMPWAGAIYNGASAIERPSRDIPSWYGWGGA